MAHERAIELLEFEMANLQRTIVENKNERAGVELNIANLEARIAANETAAADLEAAIDALRS